MSALAQPVFEQTGRPGWTMQVAGGPPYPMLRFCVCRKKQNKAARQNLVEHSRVCARLTLRSFPHQNQRKFSAHMS